MTKIKKKKHEQYIKQIYRLMGYYLAEKLKNTPIRPNHITISRILLIALASIFILSNSYILHVSAAFLIILFSMFDALDGSLALLKDDFSVVGTWLDPQIDRLGFLILFLTLAFYLSTQSELYIYLTMYVLVIFYFRGLIPSDIKLKDKFALLREKYPKKNMINPTNKANKENELFYQIKLQTSPHTHNVAMYIAIGLILKITNLIIIFLGFYLTLWYIRENYKVLMKAIKVDKK